MKREKTNDEMIAEMERGIKEMEEEDDRKENLREILWDDVKLLSELSEMLNHISLDLRAYEMKQADMLKEGVDEL